MTSQGQPHEIDWEPGKRSGAKEKPHGVTKITEADFLRIYPKLAARVRRFGLADDQVEDIVQETFLEAHKMLLQGQFKGSSALDTWVISIGKHRCLKHYRTQRTQKRRAIEVPVDTPIYDEETTGLSIEANSPRPDHQVEGRQLLARVGRALRDLPAMLRDPLVLRARGHSYQQIARVLEVQPSLVSSRIHQARAQLHRELPDIRPPSTG